MYIDWNLNFPVFFNKCIPSWQRTTWTLLCLKMWGGKFLLYLFLFFIFYNFYNVLLWHIHLCLWWRGSGRKYSEDTISWDSLFKCVRRIVHDQVCVCRNFIPSVRTVKEHNVLFNPIAYTCQMFVLLYCWCFVNLLYLIYCIYYYMIANENAPLYVYQFSISCNAMNSAWYLWIGQGDDVI